MTIQPPAWDSVGQLDLSTLPPDLTPRGRRPDRCWRVEHATSPHGGFGCTRLAGHTGRHAAGDGTVIRAVWPRAAHAIADDQKGGTTG